MTVEERCDLALRIAQLLHAIRTVPVPPNIEPVSADEQGRLCLGRFFYWTDDAPGTLQDLVDLRLNELCRTFSDDRFYADFLARMEATAGALLDKNLLAVQP